MPHIRTSVTRRLALLVPAALVALLAVGATAGAAVLTADRSTSVSADEATGHRPRHDHNEFNSRA
ncbi:MULTISPECIES: hypothetical protein [Streptomyces]|uniref:hypothetical protein n=1 Tax=Streptomyces TaxID=1883 RepID=UPI0004BD2301|nr:MULTISPECIES: hypothetical protein [Streptomyces]KJY20896.1 hypothetical protein VR43_13360 [Streptomyces sp. NRRL S-104]KOU33667.1 hypothetical protein ADK53_18195 [Streptomyces sp. WM6373]KOU61440.1 hypothetical protein ADK96_29220 [Streptomyces sp. IGB124]KOU74266.1 hypothetical protein ADK61_20210 [Streptomyces sp. XY66]KOU87749.1 hypothetical protein ADK93_15425 [Streptomyces sp. XY58]